MVRHKQVIVNVCRNRKIQCDRDIQNLIKWMNSLNGVTTKYSCAGERKQYKGKTASFYGYVRFKCPNPRSLKVIAETFWGVFVDIFMRRKGLWSRRFKNGDKIDKDLNESVEFRWRHPFRWCFSHKRPLSGNKWGGDIPKMEGTQDEYHFLMLDGFARRALEAKAKKLLRKINQ